MKEFTVILMRPVSVGWLTASTYGQDVYFAHVEAEHARCAVEPALIQAVEADKNLELSKEDYALVAILDGHVAPVFWGWQL